MARAAEAEEQPIWARLRVPYGGTFVPVMPVTTG